jgi:hypothetical protein
MGYADVSEETRLLDSDGLSLVCPSVYICKPSTTLIPSFIHDVDLYAVEKEGAGELTTSSR